MKKHLGLIGLAASLIVSVANATPCDGIDRSLSEKRKAELAPAIAKEEKIEKVKILETFRSGDWTIIFIENYVSDEPYLFFHGDPMKTKSITAWSGAATIYEEKAMREWTTENVPGIPQNLARCFAWHVTLEGR